jgi:hypothetical protein
VNHHRFVEKLLLAAWERETPEARLAGPRDEAELATVPRRRAHRPFAAQHKRRGRADALFARPPGPGG